MTTKTNIESVESLIPYARNSRTHSAEQIDQIAASIHEFGFTTNVLKDEDGGIIAGHGRVLAAQKIYKAGGTIYLPDGEALPAGFVPVTNCTGWTKAKKQAYIIADNKLALNAGWDDELLKLELGELREAGFDLDLTGFSGDELDALFLEAEEVAEGETDPDEVPEVETAPISVTGDVWLLGNHRVMCGDSTSVSDIEKLMNGKPAQLLHADPPYGMGKAGEGVANDNLYLDKLDDFQREWWSACQTTLSSDSSVYIWGWEHNLCLFYVSILLPLVAENQATHKNWIVWDKKSGQGIKQESLRRYAPVTEHCLFFNFGIQEKNNNADNYWDGWEPVRLAIKAATDAQGWKVKDINAITGTQMGGHWVTKSQWTFVTAANWEKLVAAAKKPEAFPAYDDLRAIYETAKAGDDGQQNGYFSRRSYFDNTHDAMTDVWHFARVTGDERHTHATPKPVEMMERVMLSSLPKGGVCLEPFGGSGSTLMGAERTGRVCYTMELQARYVDVIVKRWQNHTGKAATLESTGQTFADLEAERLPAEAAE